MSNINCCYIGRYIWHLYLRMFPNKPQAQEVKHLANTFRIVHALVTSVPLLLLNLITLVNSLKYSDDALDVSYLVKHLNAGIIYIIILKPQHQVILMFE